MAKAGVKAADALANLYSAVIHDRVETAESLTFQSKEVDLGSCRIAPRPPEDPEVVNNLLDQLELRRAMALRMQKAYSSLATLAQYRTGEIRDSGNALGGALKGLGAIQASATKSSDPTSAIGAVADVILTGKQARDIRKSAASLMPLVEKVGRVVAAEREVYTAISDQRAQVVGNTVRDLVNCGIVDPMSLFSGVTDPLGLKVQDSSQPTKEQIALRPNFAELARGRYIRERQEISDAFALADRLLSALNQSHREFEKSRGVNLQQLTILAEKTDALAAKLIEKRQKAEAK